MHVGDVKNSCDLSKDSVFFLEKKLHMAKLKAKSSNVTSVSYKLLSVDICNGGKRYFSGIKLKT